MRHVHIVARIGILVVAMGVGARADEQGRIVISTDTKAKKGMYPIAVPLALSGDPELVKMVGDLQAFDLNVSSWFKVLAPNTFLPALKAKRISIHPPNRQ